VATTTPINGHPVATDSDSPLGGTQAQTYGTHAEKYSNMRPTSSANRTSLIPSPAEGMETYRMDVNVKEIYDGTKWVPYIQGGKLLGIDTGAGMTGAAAPGPFTVHGARTVSDPFGTGVPFLLAIYATATVDGSTGINGSLQLMTPALGATVVRSARFEEGAQPAVFHVQAFASGGSQSYSTRLANISGGTVTTYADVTNNYAIYVALPLFT
jgi:hypothetical protein